MKGIIQDIRNHISLGAYQNEEHVRICIVARLLQSLGWNIWNPKEVCAEYVPNRDEDLTRVDFGLFPSNRNRCIFIEVKALGRMQQPLQDLERQLRDYNRNLTAVFSILTDGKFWRFYLSQSGGDFSGKCFKVLNLQEDELDDIEEHLMTFLSKVEIASGRAETEAKNYLRKNQKQRIMNDCLPEARRIINQPPYPNLPNALVKLVHENGIDISIDEALQFINLEMASSPSTHAPAVVHVSDNLDKQTIRSVNTPMQIQRQAFPPDNPPSLKHTKYEIGFWGQHNASNWNALLNAAIRAAIQNGMTPQEIRTGTTVNLYEGVRTDAGYHQIQGTNISIQGMNADYSYRNAYYLAKKMGVELKVQFCWHDKDGAIHPGLPGVIHYVP